MTILGIDPGYGTIGYGVVRFENFKFTPVQYGAAPKKACIRFRIRRTRSKWRWSAMATQKKSR